MKHGGSFLTLGKMTNPNIIKIVARSPTELKQLILPIKIQKNMYD